MMRLECFSALIATLLAVGTSTSVPAAGPEWPKSLTIGTASPGGLYYLYGDVIAQIRDRPFAHLFASFGVMDLTVRASLTEFSHGDVENAAHFARRKGAIHRQEDHRDRQDQHARRCRQRDLYFAGARQPQCLRFFFCGNSSAFIQEFLFG